MARLSDSESVLEKLDGLYYRLNDFYTAIEGIQALQKGIQTAHDSIMEQEVGCRKQQEALDVLKSRYETSLARLDEIARDGSRQTAVAADEFNARKNEIDTALRTLTTDRQETETRLSDALDHLEVRTGRMTEYIRAEHEDLRFLKNDLRLFKTRLETAWEEKTSRIKMQINVLLADAEEKLTGLFARKNRDLKKLAADVDALQKQASAQLAETRKNAEDISKKLTAQIDRDRKQSLDLRAEVEKSLQDLSEQHQRLQTETLEMILGRTAQAADAQKRIEQDMIRHFSALRDQAGQETGRLEHFRASVEENITAGLCEQIEMMQTAVSQALDELDQITDNRLAELSEKQRLLQDEVIETAEGYISDVSETILNRTEERMQEIEAGFESRGNALEQMILALPSPIDDITRIEDALRVLGNQTGDADHMVRKKLAALTGQMKKALGGIRQNMTQKIVDSENQVKQMVLDMEPRLKTRLEGSLETRIEAKLKTSLESSLEIKIKELIAGYQETLTDQCRAEIQEQAAAAKDAEINERIKRQLTVDDKLDTLARIQDQIQIQNQLQSQAQNRMQDSIMTGMAALQKSRDEQREKESKIIGFLKKLNASQQDMLEKYADMEKRLRALEIQSKD